MTKPLFDYMSGEILPRPPQKSLLDDSKSGGDCLDEARRDHYRLLSSRLREREDIPNDYFKRE